LNKEQKCSKSNYIKDSGSYSFSLLYFIILNKRNLNLLIARTEHLRLLPEMPNLQ